jgi:C1A family cysteine protease
MNKLVTVLFIVSLSLGSSIRNYVEEFEGWVNSYKINVKGVEEKERMMNIWIENDKYIEEVNSRNLTYKLGHNQFSGMNNEEYRRFLGIKSDEERKERRENIKDKIDEIKCIKDCIEGDEKKLEKVKCVKECLKEDELEVEGVELSEEVDWVKKGGVTNVKNQGQCGSCWSFSTTGALEGAYFVKYGILKSFSEQQLVDCDNRKNGGKDMGCNGGLMDNAFSWIEKNGGLCYEEDYKYVSGETRTAEVCDKSCEIDEKSEIKSYTDVKKSSDEAMMTALMQQPVSIAIQADQKDFQLYKSGVFTGSCGTKLDHGVLVVGYGNAGEDYYLVKNSWGTSWGENGYIKLGRGEQYNNGDGQCGMLMQGSYPNL